MLKAVRFDENEHKLLLDYIGSYIDNRGKRNESEAIRFLMGKGLEALQNKPQSQIIDIDKLKAELFQQIMTSIPVQPIRVWEEALPPHINPKAIAKLNLDVATPKEEAQKLSDGEEESSKPVTPNNPLVANMLANRKR